MSDIGQARTVHVDQHLSNVAINYKMSGFIADQIAPIVSVDKQTNTFIEWTQADIFRREDTKRSPLTEAKRISWSVSSQSYLCQNYALKTGISLEARSNMDAAFARQWEEGAVMRVTDALLLDWETRVASLAENTGNVGSNFNVHSAWTSSGALPVNDLHTAIDNVRYSTGYTPNTILFGSRPWDYFRRHWQTKSILNNPNMLLGGQQVTQDAVARYFGVDKVLVGLAMNNTAAKGQSLVVAPVWGDHVTVYFAPPVPSMQLPSWMYSFRWTVPGLPNLQVERLPYDAKIKGQDSEVGYYQDERVTASRLAFQLRFTGSAQA